MLIQKMHQNSYSLSKDEFDLENENIRFLKKLKYSIKCESREKYKFTLQYCLSHSFQTQPNSNWPNVVSRQCSLGNNGLDHP